MYYDSKLTALQDIFGTNDVRFGKRGVTVNGTTYPIVDDVIILLEPRQYPTSLKNAFRAEGRELGGKKADFA